VSSRRLRRNRGPVLVGLLWAVLGGLLVPCRLNKLDGRSVSAGHLWRKRGPADRHVQWQVPGRFLVSGWLDKRRVAAVCRRILR
jgi:hypothetical protein